MMEVFVPFVLIFVSWNDGSAAESMDVFQRVFVDRATCVAAGEELLKLAQNDQMERLQKSKAEQIKTERFKYFCVEHQSEIEKYQPIGGQ